MLCVKEKPITLGLIHKDRHVHSEILDPRGSSITLTACDARHPVNVAMKASGGSNGEGENAEGIPFPEATEKGYAMAEDGDGVYITNLKGKRGVVQKGKIQTIKTSLDVGVVKKEKANE